MSRSVIEPIYHGTNYGYNKLGCRCPLCTRAHRERADQHRVRAAEALVIRDGRPYSPLARHGTTTGYTYYSCRCSPCTEVKAISNRNR